MDKSEIGAHLTGLPPATARGLHNLFDRMLDEIHTLRQAAHWHAPGAEIVPLDHPIVEPQPTGGVLPPVGDPDPVALPVGSEPINTETAPAVDGDAAANADTPADLPTAA